MSYYTTYRPDTPPTQPKLQKPTVPSNLLRLHQAICNDNVEIVLSMIDRKVDLNGIYQNTTPLILAVEQDHEVFVEILLEAGADANYAPTGKSTPLGVAVKGRKNIKIIKLLIDHAADVNGRIYEYSQPTGTIFRSALNWRNYELVKILIRAGVKGTDQEDRSNMSGALPLAAENNDLEMIEYLLSRGADPNYFTGFDANPVGRAALHNNGDSHLAAIRLLLNRCSMPVVKEDFRVKPRIKFYELIFNQLDKVNERIDKEKRSDADERIKQLEKKIEEIEERHSKTIKFVELNENLDNLEKKVENVITNIENRLSSLEKKVRVTENQKTRTVQNEEWSGEMKKIIDEVRKNFNLGMNRLVEKIDTKKK